MVITGHQAAQQSGLNGGLEERSPDCDIWSRSLPNRYKLGDQVRWCPEDEVTSQMKSSCPAPCFPSTLNDLGGSHHGNSTEPSEIQSEDLSAGLNLCFLQAPGQTVQLCRNYFHLRNSRMKTNIVITILPSQKITVEAHQMTSLRVVSDLSSALF